MSSYINKNDDAIGDILGNGTLENADDIQVINRDGDLFQNDFHSNLFDDFGVDEEKAKDAESDRTRDNETYDKINDLHEKSIGFNDKFSNKPTNIHNPNLNGLPIPNANIPNPLNPSYNFPKDSFNDLISHQNNQLTTLGSSKYLSSPLPTLQPLSESVNIPHVQPLTITSDEKNKISKKKKEPSGTKTRPAFVMKIWSMVNDPANKEYIRWNDDGKTFQVFHTEEFMKVILPKYFKHNNFASFVRQLNMYGWHKVQDITNGTLNQGKVDNDEICQFENPYFIRDRKDLLDKIVRNKSVNQAEEVDSNSINFNVILSELDQIKMNQMAIGEDLRRVRKDNKTLWQENFITRERHQHQAKTLDKILNFLAAVYGNNAGKILEVDGMRDENSVTQFQPNPYANPQNPYQKPRLMLTNEEHRRSADLQSQKSDGTYGGNYSGDRYRPTNITRNLSNISRETPLSHRGSTDTGSIEEIMRSYGNTPNAESANNVNKIYQQLINQEPGVSSPRHYFPELMGNEGHEGGSGSGYRGGYRGQISGNALGTGTDSPISGVIPGPSGPINVPTGTAPTVPGPQIPSGQGQVAGSPDPMPYIRPGPNEDGDIMHGLEQNVFKQGQSIQQVQDWIQKLATQQQQHQATINEIHDELKPDLDEFDVNEFLNNNNSTIETPSKDSVASPMEESGEKRNGKRSIEDIYGDIMQEKKRANI
jgi:heat shock transcription factor